MYQGEYLYAKVGEEVRAWRIRTALKTLSQGRYKLWLIGHIRFIFLTLTVS